MMSPLFYDAWLHVWPDAGKSWQMMMLCYALARDNDKYHSC